MVWAKLINIPLKTDGFIIPSDRKNKIVDYLHNGTSYASCPRSVKDAITGERVNQEYSILGDDKYRWSTEFVYNIEKYDSYTIPKDFFDHILSKIN